MLRQKEPESYVNTCMSSFVLFYFVLFCFLRECLKSSQKSPKWDDFRQVSRICGEASPSQEGGTNFGVGVSCRKGQNWGLVEQILGLSNRCFDKMLLSELFFFSPN